MAISLYDALVPTWQQTLGAVEKLLDKAQAHCAQNQLPDTALTSARLAPDMLPLSFQVKSSVVHSIGAIDAVRQGVFMPNRTPAPDSLAELKTMVTQALQVLSQIESADLSAFIGRDMRFEMGDYRMDFTAENYLLSFALPNFFFHAVTTYDILRHQGIAIGKGDFLGRVRKKS